MTMLVKCDNCGHLKKAEYSMSEGYEVPLSWEESGNKHYCEECIRKLEN